MCGRFSFATPPDALIDEFGPVELTFELRPRYNIAPTQEVATVLRDPERARDRVGPLRWGLIPGWAREASIGNRLINARAETVAEKPSFRAAFARRRCLVLADGFYEWQRVDDGKVPMRVRRTGDRPFAFAGLWERWQAPDTEPIFSCTIITTDAAPELREIHPRMPVILPAAARDRWLDPSADRAALQEILRPYDGGDLEAYPVSTLVNSPRNDRPECFEPAV